MIHIFFVPGMFGSTIEYVLRDFTNEFVPTNATIANNGSMHTFQKQYHPISESMLDISRDTEITTPIYPFNNSHLPDILKLFPMQEDDRCILVYAKSFEKAEQNILFQYYKIALGVNTGMSIFYGPPANAKSDVHRWNNSYSYYSDLVPWEFREWFSIFYPSWIREWQDSYQQVPDSWLKVAVDDILTDSVNTFEKIIDFCNLTKKDGLDDFVARWQLAQKYILDEYKLIDNIVDLTINQQQYSWPELHPVAEAMIQKKLRDRGFEIRCDGLNIFPTNSKDLYNLLDNQLQLHHQETPQ